MNDKIEIMTDTAFWTDIAQRYFEAECSEAEEELLKSFVASPFSYDDAFDSSALRLFQDVRATMSLFAAAKKLNGNGVKRISVSQKGRIWKWTAVGIAAAVAGVTFILLPSSDGTAHDDICRAMVNGRVVTDRDEVISLMRDSWDDIGLHDKDAGVVEAQMKEMFDISE